ncbi:MAG: hypothetical protein LLF92_03380 [Planctomycetaceae bacterium]|nr:hypothetical protein [Planctomycetaceae bacterium]
MAQNDFYIQYNNGTAIYLPAYVKYFRYVEKEIVDFLSQQKALEIIVPKIISSVDVQRLEQCNPRFYKEWDKEQLSVYTKTGQFVGYLAHWQCEPVYKVLGQLLKYSNDCDPQVFYDNSGFSYRYEETNDIFRFDEFRRIEIFLVGSVIKIKSFRDMLLNFLKNLVLPNYSEIVFKPDESFGGKEEVVDLEVVADGRRIEVCGSHVHYCTFKNAIGILLGENIITACIGISLSRLAMLLTLREQIASKCINAKDENQVLNCPRSM